MTTARELITRAARSSKVLALGEPLPNDNADHWLDLLNEMAHDLALDGIDLGWSDLTIDDTVPVPDDHIRTLRSLLAVEIAGNVGRAVPPDVQATATTGKAQLQKRYVTQNEMQVDRGMTLLPSRRWGRL